MRIQSWLRLDIENGMTKLKPNCTGCCVRSITQNAMTSGTHTHTPQPFQKNDEYKMHWNFNIQTDKFIERRRSDIVCIAEPIYRLYYAW